MTADLELTLLGTVHITWQGTPIHGFVSSKAQALLCYLAITRRVHTREELANLLWSDMGETEARANLRGVLHNLRQLVGCCLLIDRQTVTLDPQASCWSDVAHVQAALLRSTPDSDATSYDELRQAIDLYQGDLLHGIAVRQAPVFDEWLLAEREHVRQLVVQSLYMLAARYTMLGDYDEAIRYTTRLLDMDPWREEMHRQLMLLLALSGQRSAALRQYDLCRQILVRDLHVEPADDTTALHRRILDGSWLTVWSDDTSPRSARTREQKASTTQRMPFTGRSHEYEWLFRQWHAISHAPGVFTLVQGVAGIGKTRLIEEVLHHVAGLGALVLRGPCQQFAYDLPYQPIVGLLRDALRNDPNVFHRLPHHTAAELARMLPILQETDPSLVTTQTVGDETGRLRLFEAIAQVLKALATQHSTIILFLDDLQWVDQPTVDLLRYVLGSLRGTSIWCIGTYRPDEVGADHPLLRLLYDLERMQRVARLSLRPLHMQAHAQLTKTVYGLENEQHQQLTAYLHAEAEGNPFIIQALLSDLEQRELLRCKDTTWQFVQGRVENPDVPTSIHAMILGRLSQLPASARTLLEVAACLGRSFDARLLRSVAAIHDQDIDESIEVLLAHDLLRETPIMSDEPLVGSRSRVMSKAMSRMSQSPSVMHYTFTHPMIPRVIAAGLSYSYRQRLHDRITRASLTHSRSLSRDIRREKQPRIADDVINASDTDVIAA